MSRIEEYERGIVTGDVRSTSTGDSVTPFVDWGSGSDDDSMVTLQSKYPVPDEVKAAAGVVAGWLLDYVEFLEGTIQPVMRTTMLDDEVKGRLFGAYTDSMGILGSIGVALGVIEEGMAVHALVDPELARAIRRAAEDVQTFDDEFEARLNKEQ